jgi:protein-arginine kinase
VITLEPSLELLSRPPRWIAANANPAWLATRVTVIRNLAGAPFVPEGADRRRLLEQLEVLTDVLGPGARRAVYDDRGGTGWWSERALWPPILSDDARLYLSAGEDHWLILGGQDHAVFSTLETDSGKVALLLDRVRLFEEAFSAVGEAAHDDEHGYLTSSPRRAGAGIGVELLMHLPGLMLTRQLRRLLSAAAQLGFWGTAIGPVGGGLVTLVNLVALRRRPGEILESAARVGGLLAGAEETARGALMRGRRNIVEDGVGRAWGILAHGSHFEELEAGTLCSWLRLGRCLDLVRRPSLARINVALWSLQGDLLESLAGWRSLTPRQARGEVLARLGGR